MSMSAPAPPDPNVVAAAQTTENQNTAKYQAETNMVNQTNPYGSLSYSQTGTNPDGSPIFSATTQLNPQSQGLWNTAINTEQGIGNAANSLIGNLGGTLSTAPNLGNDALVSKEMGWENKFLQPWMNAQNSNLASSLANQGVTQGSPAWNTAEAGLSQAQSGTEAQNFANFEPTAFEQSLASYQAPIQTLGTLLGESQPGSVNSSLTQTPQENIQPANISADTYQSYNAQNQNYQQTMAGLFGLGSSVVKGLAGGWGGGGAATGGSAAGNLSPSLNGNMLY